MSKYIWDSNNIKDQAGRIAVVTGSTGGIGYEAAKVLASKNAKVIMAVRDTAKGEKAKQQIEEEFPGSDVEVMYIDLADLSTVKNFALEFKSRYNRLDLLINNAGVMIPPRSNTKDGFELQFGTNHLGHFALTGQILELMMKTPGSRVVNVSSFAHLWGNLNFQDLNVEKSRYNKWKSYGDSKIANIYFTFELNRRLQDKGANPLAASSHPGWSDTGLMRHSGPIEWLAHLIAQDQKMGVLPTLYAALAEDVNPGDYIGPAGFLKIRGYPERMEPARRTKDRDIAARLWEISEELTGVKFPF